MLQQLLSSSERLVEVHTLCPPVLQGAQAPQTAGRQAGGSASGCSVPVGRRGHSLVGLQGRFLLLTGGYSGSSDLLADTWLYDTHRDCWLPVDVLGECFT
jgi:hypothetical protein